MVDLLLVLGGDGDGGIGAAGEIAGGVFQPNCS